MRALVAQHLQGADATITFRDSYPAMPPTAGGQNLLAKFDAVSRSMRAGRRRSSRKSRESGDVPLSRHTQPGWVVSA